MGRLQGTVALVTGAGSGIGAVTAHALAAQGAKVVLADINREAAETRRDEIRAHGGTAEAAAVDLAQETQIAALMQEAVRHYGRLDVLVNNAAHTRLAQTADTSVEQMTAEVWDEMMQVNLRGTMLAIKHALPLMRKQGGGSIVNTASISGLSGGSNTAYGVSKAGIVSLTQYVATQYGQDGIRCNAIAPGVIVTPATSDGYAAGEMRNIILRQQLTPRLGRPEDIAHAVVYLASPESEFVTGQVLSVDGGILAHLPFMADFNDLRARRDSA